MGEHRKVADKRMKSAEQEIRHWHARMKTDIDEMVADLLTEMLDRHRRLASAYQSAGEQRDEALHGLGNMEKDLHKIKKSLSKSSVDRAAVAKDILKVAQDLGGVAGELKRIEEEVAQVRANEALPNDLVSEGMGNMEAASPEWSQAVEGVESIYTELEAIPQPKRVKKLQEAFEQSRMDVFLARTQSDGSEAAAEQWRDHLEGVLGGNPRANQTD